jgi:hypothetical protein
LGIDASVATIAASPNLQTPPTPQACVLEMDDIDAREAPLRRLLALASVVGLPQQIEREEANSVRIPQMAFHVTHNQ